MMNKLSTPVAPSPLHRNDDPTPVQPHNDTNMYDAVVDEEESNRIEKEMSSIIESFFVSPVDNRKDEEEEDNYTQSNSHHSLDFER